MRILFITPPPYLPNRLHRIRSYDFVRILSKKHQVHLLSLTTENSRLDGNIRKICESVTIVNLNKVFAIFNVIRLFNVPAEAAYCYSSEAQEKIREIVNEKKINLVYVKRLRSILSIPELTIPVIIDTTDAMSLFYKRMASNHDFPKKDYYRFESRRYKKFERAFANKYKDWIVSSHTDSKYLKRNNSRLKIHIIPNAIDTKYFLTLSKINSQKLILMSGLMDKPVNVNAATYLVKNIFPLVKKKIPRAKIAIVGPKPNFAVRNLQNLDIRVMGYVKDLRKVISKADVIVAPIRIATGVRNKILQAWSMEKPVVATSIGASGLLYKNGTNIEIADSPELFAKKVINVLTNPAHANKLAINGRKTVETEYSFEKISKKLEKVLNEVAGKAKRIPIRK